MKIFTRTGILIAGMGCSVFAQSLIEHAAMVGNSSVAANQAALAKIEHNIAPPPSFFSGDSAAQPTAASVLAASRRDMPLPPAALEQGPPALTLVKPLNFSLVAAVTSKEQLLSEAANLQTGATRDQAIARLGNPAYRISFDDDGVFMERCRFRASGEDIVMVEFKDGAVSLVKVLTK